MPALTEFDVNLTIGSAIGFRQVGGGAENGAIIGPFPTVQTMRDLEGNVYNYGDAQRAIVEVEPLNPFYLYPYSNSAVQTVTMNNIGNTPLVITSASDITFSSDSVTAILTATFPISVPPSGSATFGLAYSGNEPGNYINFFIINSNHYSRKYKVITEQIVGNTFSVRSIPTNVITTTTVLGQQYLATIELIPVLNGVDNFDTVLEFTALLDGNDGWTATTGINSVNLIWDPDTVNNLNNTTTGYVSTLTVSTVGADTIAITNTAYVDIDYTKYRNLSSWISPASSYNSLIGISFDIVNGIKTLTIGVGAGGDGTPIYADSSGAFAVLRNLAIGSASVDVPYPYWSTVYSFSLTASNTYLSGEIGDDGFPMYMRKTTDGLNYADYFGYEQGVGSMFVVEYDGYGTVNININNLRELSGEAEFDATMENLTRAFYYYSAIDQPARYYQLETPQPGDPRTQLFRGFEATSFTPETWVVNTNLVPYPT
jgi:hypothetical protein